MKRTTRFAVATIAIGMAIVAWTARGRVLAMVGDGLVVDDAPAPVAVIVSSLATARAGALESARLYRDGVARTVVVARWQTEALDDEMRALGVPWLPVHELAIAVLEKS